VAQLVAPLVLIHVVGLPDPYHLPCVSARFVSFYISDLCLVPVYHMVLIANMTCNGCPGLFCSSKDFCDAIHFFTMFFYSYSQWPSCFSNIATFTVFTWYLVNHFGQLNVGETQMTKFSSDRPVKLTLNADQSLVKWVLSVICRQCCAESSSER